MEWEWMSGRKQFQFQSTAHGMSRNYDFTFNQKPKARQIENKLTIECKDIDECYWVAVSNFSLQISLAINSGTSTSFCMRKFFLAAPFTPQVFGHIDDYMLYVLWICQFHAANKLLFILFSSNCVVFDSLAIASVDSPNDRVVFFCY